MRHQATRALYDYWNEVRRGRFAPRRLEIQPARIGDVLLDTFILEHMGRDVFRFRLAGTRAATCFGADLRDTDFLSCWSEGDAAMLTHHLSSITELGRVGLFTGELHAVGEAAPRAFELLVLPLMHTGYAIDRLLCLMVPLDEADGAAPRLRTPNLKLLAAEAIWPNEDASLGLDDRQLPLSPHVRTARIVRQGRRQFRVYEGGLDAAKRDAS